MIDLFWFYLLVCTSEPNANYLFISLSGVPVKNVTVGRVLRGVDEGSSSSSATVLSSIYRTCINVIWQKNLLIQQTTRAILQSGHVSLKMNQSQWLRFFMLMKDKYKFETLIDITSLRRRLRIFQRSSSAWDEIERCAQCASEIVTTFNSVMGSDVTTSQLLSFKDTIPRRGPVQRIRITDNLTQYLPTIFQGLSYSQLTSIFGEVNIILDNITTIEISAGDKLRAVMEILTQPDLQPISIAYVISGTVLEAYYKLHPSDNSTHPTAAVLSKCSAHLNSFPGLWDSVYAQSYTDPHKDGHVRHIYSMILDSMLQQVSSSPLLEPADRTSLEVYLKNISLLLPSDLIATDVSLPDISPSDFVGDYLASLDFEYNVYLWKLRSGLPDMDKEERFKTDVYGNRFLWISPSSYLDMNFNSSNVLLANLPVVGMRIAAVMAFTLLTFDGFSEATQQKVWNAFLCLLKWYFGDIDYQETHLLTVTYVEGLSTVLRIVDTKDWDQRKGYVGVLGMSDSQFFFIKYAYSWCTNVNDPVVINNINMPLMNSGVFAATFHCGARSRMTNASDCKPWDNT